MQLGISDGFKFGCGFALALAASSLVFLIFAATMVLLGILLDVQLPNWLGFFTASASAP